MKYASRLRWRVFYLPLTLVVAGVMAMAQGPALTTVTDTVYRADGSPANGVLLISWPAFTTADGHAVAAGNTAVLLGSNGFFSVQLAPNAGAVPAGVLFTVVYQLSDGAVECLNSSAWAQQGSQSAAK